MVRKLSRGARTRSVGWSEDRLHRWLLREGKPRALSGSRGHDAAVLHAFPGRVVTCVDSCVEGVHFESDADPRLVGAKSAGRALSDLAATAAVPRAVVLALRAPRERDEAWMRRVIEGVRLAARAVGADLVGGDLCAASGPASACVTALGSYSGSRSGSSSGSGRPPGRDRARAGQRVVLTGPVGGSLSGRHLAIRPRIEEGIALHAAGATAMMDVSDGLAWDLHRLARASDVAIHVELARVPVHRDARRMARTSGRTPLDHALHDGEDHELLATMPRARVEEARRACATLVDIGRVTSGRGLHLIDERGVARLWDPREGGCRHGV